MSTNPFSVDVVVSVLSRTPMVLRALLQDQPGEMLNVTEGANRWSPFDVLGHLIHGEKTDWIPRVRIILEYGESRPFVPFNREAMFEDSKNKSTAALLEEFEKLRHSNLQTLADLRLSPAQLSQTGIHPALGTVTLAQLLSSWAVHDLDHLAQIFRTIAKTQDTHVGPWKQYLSILTDRV